MPRQDLKRMLVVLNQSLQRSMASKRRKSVNEFNTLILFTYTGVQTICPIQFFNAIKEKELTFNGSLANSHL